MNVHKSYAAKNRGLNYKSRLMRIKSMIIEYLEIFIKPKYNLKTKKISQYIWEVAANIINCIQLICLLWYPKMNINGWDSYSSFWKIIAYFRFDNIIIDLNIMKFCFYTISASLVVCIISLILIGYFKRRGSKISNVLVMFPSQILGFLSSIGFIPSLMILNIIAKFSYTHQDSDEYSASDWDLGPLGVFIGVVSSVLLVILSVTYELFSADLRHSSAYKNVIAKADSNLDIVITLGKVVFVYMHIYVGSLNHLWYMVFVLTSSLILAFFTFRFNSYYDALVNSIKISKMFILAMCSLSFIVGTWLDNAGVIFLLFILIIPVLCAISMFKMYKETQNLNFSQSNLNNQHIFELKLRKNLFDHHSPESEKIVVDSFKNVYKSDLLKVDKLFVVWEVNYCIFTLKNLNLARIKMARMINVASNIEGDIQEWRIDRYLNLHKENVLSDLNFLNYLVDLERAKHADETLCYQLLEFWNEITLKVPRLHKLENLLDRIAELIDNAGFLYNSMMDQKNEKVYDLYGTLLQTILHRYEEGTSLMARVNYNKKKDKLKLKIENKLTRFDDEIGIILISANKDTLGEIMFINEISAEILQVSTSEIIGNGLSRFIPDPFSKDHQYYLKRFLDDYQSSVVDNPSVLFILDSKGSLKECQVLIRLTPLSNYLYFMVGLRPINSTRQVALTTKDGFIYSQSNYFSEYLGIKTKWTKDQHLNDFLAEKKFEEMGYFEPVLIYPNNQILALIKCFKYFKTTKIFFVLLIKDEAEIDIWLRNMDISQLEYFGKTASLMDLESINNRFAQIPTHEREDRVKFVETNNISVFSSHNDLDGTHDFGKTDELKSLFSEEKLVSNSQVQSTSSVSKSKSSLHSGKSIILKSQNILSRFRVVLFFSILAVTATNIAISIYIAGAVSHSRSINTFTELGNILYDTAHIAELSREMDYNVRYNFSKVENTALEIENTLVELIESHDMILKNLNKWSYCHASNVILDNIVPMWKFESEPLIVYINFYDAVEEFVKNTKEFVIISRDAKQSTKNFYFILANGLGNLNKQVNATLDGLVTCETERILEISQIITLLFISGVIILGICLTTLTIFIFIISNGYNTLWKFIKRITHPAFFELKRSCIDRLQSVHGIDTYEEEQDSVNRTKLINEKLKFKIYRKFLSRLSIFLVVTMVYYFVVHLELYPNCEKYLKERPKLLRNYVQRRALIPAIDFWAREKVVWQSDHGNGFEIILEKNIFMNPDEELEKALDSLKAADIVLLADLGNMSDSLLSELFEIGNMTLNPGIALGSYWFAQSLLQDAITVLPADHDYIAIWTKLTKDMLDLQTAMKNTFSIVNESSQRMIVDQMHYMVYSIMAYSLFSVFIYVFYYFPYLSHEMKKLLRLQLIISIIPATYKSSKNIEA